MEKEEKAAFVLFVGPLMWGLATLSNIVLLFVELRAHSNSYRGASICKQNYQLFLPNSHIKILEILANKRANENEDICPFPGFRSEKKL